MKLVSTFLIIFLAIQTGTARNAVVKKGILDRFLNFFNGMKECFQKAVADFKSASDDILKCMKKFLADIGIEANKIKVAFKEEVNKFIEKAKTIKDEIAKPVLEKFKAALIASSDKFQKFVNDSKTKVEKWSKELGNKSKEALDSILKQMQAQGKVIEEQMKKIAAEVKEGEEKVKICFEIHMPQVQDMLSSNTEDIKSSVDTVKGKFEELNEIILGNIKIAIEIFKGCNAAGLECLQTKPDDYFVVALKECFASVSTQLTKEVGGLTVEIINLCSKSAKAVPGLIAEIKNAGVKLLEADRSKGTEIINSFKKCCQ